ncbi:hypothetical protein [Pseudoclavibacter caeni]|uniref:Uncharacterized protein n=1 Tax=Pseudoclavibacter caeni TaxID=908846 RepID=A0A7C8BQU1_9MICO|nr:hypothetical protein [Pseudoclavibacter caeni]KAB1631650.1 hypothetical protein F8O02_06805 [Pseudoclavibacter caeni]NYJ97273.1 hypothetical protein [Pseudoclavibacter caeni]
MEEDTITTRQQPSQQPDTHHEQAGTSGAPRAELHPEQVGQAALAAALERIDRLQPDVEHRLAALGVARAHATQIARQRLRNASHTLDGHPERRSGIVGEPELDIDDTPARPLIDRFHGQSIL